MSEINTDQQIKCNDMLQKILAKVLHLRGERSIPLYFELYADLGIDSRAFLAIIIELEKAMSIKIDDEDLLERDLITVGDLIEFLSELKTMES